MDRDLNRGSVLKVIVYFSLPYLLSYLLQTLYGMADLFIIGQYDGVASTTAVSIGSQVMRMITVMLVGLAMGSTVMIGRAIGSRDKSKSALTVGNSITLFLSLSIIITIVLLLLVNPIVNIISTPTEAIAGTQAYLIICFMGIPFIAAYNIISSIFRGMGDSKSPMYFVAIACIFNIALDYLFIGGMGMGPAGAALGTSLSQAISVIVSYIAIKKRRMLPEIKREDFKLRRKVTKEILNIGVPIALQDGFIQVSFIIITIFANRRGLNDAAAVGIVEKLVGILFLVPSSMLATVSALASQNIGAGKHSRAKETLFYSSIITTIFGIIAAISLQFIAEPVVSLFINNSDNAQVVTMLGGQYMKAYVWDCILAGIHFCFSGYFCAYGLSNISFMHNSISIVIARIPLTYLASKYFLYSLYPMGLASPIGSAVSVIICLIAYRWMQKNKIY